MTIGGSIFLLAVGAILKFAVTATAAGIDIQVVGVILMVAGAIGLVLGLFLIANNRPPNDPYNQGPPPAPPAPPAY